MTNKEKVLGLKNAIYQLYSKEGRSISYLSKLFDIDRNTLSKIIKKEWGFTQNGQEERKIKEFLAQYKPFILAKIKEGWTQRMICAECKKGRLFYLKVIEYDKDIQQAMQLTTFRNKESCEFIADEVWKPIFGYETYQISNYGRVKNKFGMIKTMVNVLSGYSEVSLTKNNKRHTIRLHRLVAHAFCEGYSEEKCCVNHIDGNIQNNKASNLEWCSYSENLIHSYDELNRVHKGGMPLSYIIEYKGKYQFKTISSFARFVDKSPTQVKRWIEESPKEHEIRKIPKY